MSKRIKIKKNFSYVSLLIGLIVIELISLSVVSAVYTNNKASIESNQNILSSEIIDSFLTLGENKIERLPSNPTKEDIDRVYSEIEKDVKKFNESNQRYNVKYFINCDTICLDTSSVENKSDLYNPHPKTVELAVLIEGSNSYSQKDFRLAVFNQ